MALLLFGTPLLALGFGVVYYQKSLAQEAERLKDGALKREETAHSTERLALKRTEEALEGQTRSVEQVRATLDLTTDELVGKVLAKQSKIGREEREFLEKLISSYSQFAAGGDGNREKQLLSARARLRIANLQQRLGDSKAALGGYREAVKALRLLAKEAEAGAQVRRELATALIGCTRTAPITEGKQSIDDLKEALQLREESIKIDPNNPDRLRELGAAELAAADLLSEMGALEMAAPIYRQYIRDLQAPTLQGILGPSAYEQLGEVYDHLARLQERQNKFDEAYRELDGAVGLFGVLERTYPAEARFRHLRIKARTKQVALLHRAGKTGEADEVIAPLVASYREMVKSYPAVREYRQGQAASLTIQVTVFLARGKKAEAVKALEEARGTLTRLVSDYPEFPTYRTELIVLLRELSRVNKELGRVEAATKANEEADAIEGENKK